ncbi:FliG C-terminal domain protein [Bacteriovorax sp. BAL6_X]|uniref:FliG C-terminal domain-containing protein n=1 Tax=Bacteriovorax sp. BAL6_X TaxID=1201290 RepID=UPI00038661AD|nr:FliG C-terminal domain-containing protein [Bacteriovorax sp. BAL6_X]EPZ50981.1 FliG C-terminal domain protein [Bacteriovorax sp. BAL6_X]
MSKNSKESGFEAILEAISLMNKEEKETLITNITKMDFDLADKLRASMYRLKDLQFITPQMMSEFLREVKTESLAKALKLEEEEVRDGILAKLPKSIREDILFFIQKKLPKSQALEAHQEVMLIYSKMIDDERLIISRDDKLV